MATPDWKRYEHQIEKYLRSRAGTAAQISYDVKRRGTFSDTLRQVDIWVDGIFAGFITDATAAVDCKHFSRKIDVQHVEQFIGLIDDVGADFGVMFTTSGYTPAASQRVQRGIRLHTMALDLAIVPPKEERVFSALPAADEGAYAGEFYDHEPYGEAGALVMYEGPMILGEQVEPGEQDVLASGPEVDWADEDGKRRCASVILDHHHGSAPDEDAVEEFINALGWLFEPGQPWVLPERELAYYVG